MLLWLPSASSVAIALVVAIIVSLNTKSIKTGRISPRHIMGLTCGYPVAKVLRFSQNSRKTIFIEVGI